MRSTTFRNRYQNPYAEAASRTRNTAISDQDGRVIISQCSMLSPVRMNKSGVKRLRHLVSGAAGFIGSHLCDRLIGAGDRVVGIDNLITGSKQNLAHLEDHPEFQFIERDVTNPVDV